ncbi:MAG: proline racemase family protein [Saprospiraceae bacterium]|nr:proline racemase family protein [Saprospiraceae bacterium]
MTLYDQLIQDGVLHHVTSHDSVRIETIDLHTAGEPLRVILKGFPVISGNTVLERRRFCQDHLDHLRTALMHEPRGHQDMYGALLVPPDRDDSDFGVLFVHNEGYSTMCGHAIIALTQLVHERKWKRSSHGDSLELKIDAPCGQITSHIGQSDEPNPEVSLFGVPSFVIGKGKISLASGQEIPYTLAYGGAFYAYVDTDQIGWDIRRTPVQEIRDLGMQVKHAVMASDQRIVHPVESDLSFLYGTIFTSSKSQVADSFNVCVFAEGEIDRCPTGSGLSGRMAIEHQMGRLLLGQDMTVESISGGVYRACPVSRMKFQQHDAVVPKVSGRAHITGEHAFLLQENDPLRQGFLLH